MAKQDEIAQTAQLPGASPSDGGPSQPSGLPVFTDRTISTKDWAARTFLDIPGQVIAYLISLFPIATWIYRYNLTWFTGDV